MDTFGAMNWSLIVSIAIALIIFRIFWLRLKANNAHSPSFRKLPEKDRMAVLKECLLNNPSESSLTNLKDFCEKENLPFDAEGYRPFIKKQLELANRHANFKECDALYKEECDFIDRLAPMEFAEAERARENGGEQSALILTLEGISRLYSDTAIVDTLSRLAPAYPKAEALLKEYLQLVDVCEASDADAASLESLQKKKELWLEHLLTIEK